MLESYWLPCLLPIGPMRIVVFICLSQSERVGSLNGTLPPLHYIFVPFGNVALHTWCTPGAHPSAHLVHTWCTPGEQWSHGAHPNNEHLVHTWCTHGAHLVNSYPGAHISTSITLVSIHSISPSPYLSLYLFYLYLHIYIPLSILFYQHIYPYMSDIFHSIGVVEEFQR